MLFYRQTDRAKCRLRNSAAGRRSHHSHISEECCGFYMSPESVSLAISRCLVSSERAAANGEINSECRTLMGKPLDKMRRAGNEILRLMLEKMIMDIEIDEHPRIML